MTSEIFNFNRFWNYFLFDLKQMWRNHTGPAVFIGGLGVIVYVIWVLLSLLFTQSWTGPSLAARAVIFIVALLILVLYQSRTYGYLTDKQKGSAWLMIPASSLEKFISMLLITLLVIPLLFVVVFLVADSIICLADPTVGASLVGTAMHGMSALSSEMPELSGSMFINLSTGTIIAFIIVGLASNFLYFLLCGICFKRYKILGGIGLVFAFEVLLSILASIFFPIWSENLVYLDEVSAGQMVTRTVNWSLTVSILVTLGLAAGIFYRIKTLKH